MKLFKTSSLLFFFVLTGIGACRQSATEEATAVDFKRTDNTVIIRLDGEPERLHPVLQTSNYAGQVSSQIFSLLMTQNPQTFEFIPQLAKGRPAVEDRVDGEAFTFELFEEAVWDDGSPVTGHDFAFTMKSVFNPRVQAQRVRAYLSFITDVQVDESNPKRFTVVTNEKFIQAEEYISSLMPVLPAHVYDPEGLLGNIPLRSLTDAAQAEKLAESDPRLQRFADLFSAQQYSREKEFVSGSGPYRLDSWETGQQLVLRKKENWWGDALADRYPGLRAYPDALIYKPILDATTSLAALKAEEIDVMGNIDPQGFLEVREAENTAARYNFFTPVQLSYFNIYINNTLPKLSDKKVRRALAHAIDIDEIIQAQFNGFGERLASPVLPMVDYYNKDLPLIPFDIEKARSLLNEAGWTDSNNDGIFDKEIDGERVALSLSLMITAGRETSRAIGLLIQDNARRAGIDIQLEPLEPSVIFDRLRKKEYELGAAGRGLSPVLWNPKQYWHTQGDNRTGFGNAETDAMIDQILVTRDKVKRDQLYKRLQAIIYDEQPEIFLFMPTGRVAIHKRFEAEVTPIPPNFEPSHFKLKERFLEGDRLSQNIQ